MLRANKNMIQTRRDKTGKSYLAANDILSNESDNLLGISPVDGKIIVREDALRNLIAKCKEASGDGGGDCECPTITVGKTTTLPAGSQATVTNSGTDSETVLDFGIPAGPQGPQGESGTATIDIGDLISKDEGNIIELGSDDKLYAACCGGEGINNKHIYIDADMDEEATLDFTKALYYTVFNDGRPTFTMNYIDNTMEAFTAKVRIRTGDSGIRNLVWPARWYWVGPELTSCEYASAYVVEVTKFDNNFRISYVGKVNID